MMLISYTGLVSVYMHRSLFMWYCQGFRKPLKSNPIPLSKSYPLVQGSWQGRRELSQQWIPVANGTTCCQWKFHSHELTRPLSRPCPRITLRSALAPPLIDQRGNNRLPLPLSLRTLKRGQTSSRRSSLDGKERVSGTRLQNSQGEGHLHPVKSEQSFIWEKIIIQFLK